MIQVQWANPEKTIVLWEFTSQWTWNDFFAAKKEVDVMIDSIEGIVDSIFLTSADQKIPSNAIANFRSIIAKRHHRHDLIVLVGSKKFLTSLLQTVINFMPGIHHQIHFVNSQVEAYNVIEQAQQRRQEAS
jgi:hypothetical protein